MSCQVICMKKFAKLWRYQNLALPRKQRRKQEVCMSTIVEQCLLVHFMYHLHQAKLNSLQRCVQERRGNFATHTETSKNSSSLMRMKPQSCAKERPFKDLEMEGKVAYHISQIKSFFPYMRVGKHAPWNDCGKVAFSRASCLTPL